MQMFISLSILSLQKIALFISEKVAPLEVVIIRYYLIFAVLIIFTEVFSSPDSISGFNAATSERIRINFNTHWLFSKTFSEGYFKTDVNDSTFENVTLPHTVAVIPHSQIDTSVFGKITWYRKHFFLPANSKGRHITVEFQAVSKIADVFCNGKRAGRHAGAYTPFSVDITDFVLFGKDNVIAVEVDSRQHKEIPPEGLDVDYMIGGGIIRDVNLLITNPLHIAWVYARRDTSCSSCIDLTVDISNNGTISSSGYIKTTLNANGTTAGESDGIHYSVAPGKETVMRTIIGPIKNLVEWNPDKPFLYTLQVQLISGNKCTDTYQQRIGVRSIQFSRTDGIFRVNGHPIMLRGLNRHETYPFIGRAAANRLQRRDADIIKYDYGCNIVRCSHYPQDPEFLSRCDEIGLMVLEEMAGWNYVSVDSTWQKNALNNLNDMIIRDRNHPSIISFGVRINQSADFRGFYRETNRIAHTLAPDIPTHGVRVLGHGSESEFQEDVWAQNFTIPSGTPPVLPWITTESVGHHYPTHTWDDEARLVGQMLFHARVQDSAAMNPRISGILGWCAFDYNSPYHYSKNNINYHGVADIYRNPKHAAYFFRSQADPKLYGPMVYIAHHWSKFEGVNDIWVASNCDSVELFVNSRSLGMRIGSEYTHLTHPLFVWRKIRFSVGELKAVGYTGGSATVTFVRKTPDKPVTLEMIPDDTIVYSGGDMTRVLIAAVDKNRQAVQINDEKVSISVDGPADFLGENPVSLENGVSAFYVKTRSSEVGRITCKVQSANLTGATAFISVKSDTCNVGIK